MNDLHNRIRAAGPGGIVRVTEEERMWLNANPVQMGSPDVKRRRAVNLVEWCARQKGIIEKHNLPIEDAQIVEAVNTKARQLGGKGQDEPSAIIGFWRAIKAIL